MLDHPLEAMKRQAGAQLLLGLRVAFLLVAAMNLFGLSLSNLMRYWDTYEPPMAQAFSFGLLAVLLVIETVLMVRGRRWGRRTGAVAVAVVIFASLVSYAAVPDGEVATYVDWVFGAANWVGLMVLLDRSFWTLIAFLTTHVTIAMVNMMIFSEVSRAMVLRFTEGSISVIGHPLYMTAMVVVLRKMAASAAATGWEIEQVRTGEAVAVASHRRRQQCFADFDDSAVPLLTGLENGTLDPEDVQVQLSCAIEAARMRRLFAEADVVANPLLHELRHCIDVADLKGVLVELNTSGRWPDLPLVVRRELTEAPIVSLATAVSDARVTVVGGPDFVSVSVVADCGVVELPQPSLGGIQLDTFRKGDTLWVEVRWQPPPSQP